MRSIFEGGARSCPALHAKPGLSESGQGKILQQLMWQHSTSGVVNHSLEPWDSTVEPLGDLRKDFSRCHSLFVLVVYFKYYILQEECALSRCIEVLYYKGLDVEARSGATFCAHSLRQGVCP